MTRGKIVLITEDKIKSSIEFNGGMYPEQDGYGQEIIQALENIHTEAEHKKYVQKFNSTNHKYRTRYIVYDCVDEEFSEEDILDMTSDYYRKWFSDYLYIKNERETDVVIEARDYKTVTIKPKGICVLWFGKYPDMCSEISKDVTATFSQKVFDFCEELGWWLNIYETDIEIGKSSPLGEDFFFTVSKDNFIDDIKNYADNFDADEHAEMWVECRGKRGVPPSIRDLIDDADAIQEMLTKLSEQINKFIRS